MENKATTIEELKKYVSGNLIELPEFGEGQKFYAVLKRPSLLSLAINGKIPNQLLMIANSLFSGRLDLSESDGEDDTMQNLFKVLDIICEACFVEPTYKELKEAGIELTDEQYMAVYNYSQQGVKALEPFRK